MRRYVVFFLLLFMSAGLAAILLMRDREPVADASPADAGADAGALPGADEKEEGAAKESGDGAEEDAGARASASASSPSLGRPLRVTGLGWAPLVPGIIANGGASPGADSRFRAQDLTVHFGARSSMKQIEGALALGGAEKEGADVAIAPLTSVVASYEDLQALEPQVFFVIGWSKGREALFGTGRDGLVDLPGRGEIAIAGESGTPETFLALFLLDLAGAAPERLRLVSPGSGDAAKKAPFAAVNRAGKAAGARAGSRSVLITTADATRLIPYVAIAPRGFLENHPEALQVWIAGWLEGVDELSADVPGAAREVAELEGAPEPLALLKRLGQLDLSGLEENARVTGLAGRGAVTIEALFSRTWEIWRRAGVLSTPAPQAAPLFTDPITALVLQRKDEGRGSPAAIEPSFETRPILRLKRSRPDDAELARTAGFAAGVFARSAIRIGVGRSGERSRELIEQVCERYALPKVRMKPAPRLSRRNTAALEILAAP